jgi:glyoxylase-like metal-dependent hydrolase (beta-lactamase superfamily II)
MEDYNVYYTKKLGEGRYLITEKHSPDAPGGVNIGLVIGENKAAVIDSGFGVTDTLRSYIEKITDKPLICLVAHGHPDHAGAAALFDEVYMNERDEVLLPVSLSYDRRMGDVFGRPGYDEGLYEYCKEHIVDGTGFTYKNMDEGDVFDLGNVKLEVIAVPGHTQGSVVLLNRAENYAYISDAVGKRNALVNLPPEKRVGLTAYRDGLRRLLSEINDETELYYGHSTELFPHSYIKDMEQAVSEVLDGKTENDTPSVSHFAKRATASNKKMMEHTCGDVILVYDANTL